MYTSKVFDISKIPYEKLNETAHFLTDIFLHYPLNEEVLKGISNAREILLAQIYAEVQYYLQKEDAFMIQGEDGVMNGVLLGMECSKAKALRVALMEYRVNRTIRKTVLKAEKTVLAKNCHSANKVLSTNWQQKFVDGEYYYIKYLAVDENQRGKGIASDLLKGIIAKCSAIRMPIIVQTHNSKSVPVYQKNGFEVVNVIEDKCTEVKQWCFLKV